jgi:hypothetical protein
MEPARVCELEQEQAIVARVDDAALLEDAHTGLRRAGLLPPPWTARPLRSREDEDGYLGTRVSSDAPE